MDAIMAPSNLSWYGKICMLQWTPLWLQVISALLKNVSSLSGRGQSGSRFNRQEEPVECPSPYQSLDWPMGSMPNSRELLARNQQVKEHLMIPG